MIDLNVGGNRGLIDDSMLSTMEELAIQEELYASDEKEPIDIDTWNTMKRYLKRVYRQVKFFSDPKKMFDEPNFVQPMIRDGSGETEIQSVSVCNWILKQLGENYLIFIL